MVTLPSRKGSYCLVLRADEVASIGVGRLGAFSVLPGYYYYAGSAFGPGGIAARVSRHFRQDKTQRWHIDYLRPVCEVEGVFVSNESLNHEHVWSTQLRLEHGFSTPLKGFGSSDCGCDSHLTYSCLVQPSGLNLLAGIYMGR